MIDYIFIVTIAIIAECQITFYDYIDFLIYTAYHVGKLSSVVRESSKSMDGEIT